MTIDKLNEQKGKRAALLKDMRALDITTADGQAKYDAMEKDFDLIHAGIERTERLATAEANVRAERDSDYRAGIDSADKSKRSVDSDHYKKALNVYARQGLNGIAPEFRNALQVGTSTEGGYLVPTEFETALVALLVNQDPIRALAHKISTASDRNIPVETSKGTFDYVSEEAAYAVNSDPAFGQVVLSSFKSGGIIKVADELLQDSFFNLEQYLVSNAADRFNTLEETNFAAGDGSGKPKGIFATTSVAGVTCPTFNGGSTTALTFDNIMDLEYSLGRGYRQNAVFVMADATEKYLRKIKTGISGDTTYAWRASLEAGKPNTINSHPVVITGGAPAMGSAAKPIAFVDLSKYYICDRLGTTMQRLNELYAANGQVGFRFTRRNDGRLADGLACATITMST